MGTIRLEFFFLLSKYENNFQKRNHLHTKNCTNFGFGKKKKKKTINFTIIIKLFSLRQPGKRYRQYTFT